MPLGAALGEPAVGLLEAARRRGGGRRQLRRRRAAGPELGRRQLLAVDELLVAEADAERHDLDAPARDELGGEVAGAVGDDADRCRGSRMHGAARSVDRSRRLRRLGGLVGRRDGDDLGGVGGDGRRPTLRVVPSTAASAARRRRRPRRKWANHHDTSTTTAPPVTTCPRPVRALTRAVSTTAADAPRWSKAGVSISMPIADVPLDARLDGDHDLGHARRAEHDGAGRPRGTPASASSPGRRRAGLVAVVAEVQAQRRARPVSVNVNGLGRLDRARTSPSRRRCGRARRRLRRRSGRSTAAWSARPATSSSCVVVGQHRAGAVGGDAGR